MEFVFVAARGERCAGVAVTVSAAEMVLCVSGL